MNFLGTVRAKDKNNKNILSMTLEHYPIMTENEITEIDISSKPSVNFGGGIELLMNDKKKGGSTEIGIGELSELENDLNKGKSIIGLV